MSQDNCPRCGERFADTMNPNGKHWCNRCQVWLPDLEALCASQARELALLRPVAEAALKFIRARSLDYSDRLNALTIATVALRASGWQPPREGEETP